MTLRPAPLAALAARFLWCCVSSGVDTAGRILRGDAGHAGLVRVPVAPMSEAGAALFGAMVTLTPGSTVIDIDMERRELLLHLLDARDVEATVTQMRADFERPIAALFPARGAP